MPAPGTKGVTVPDSDNQRPEAATPWTPPTIHGSEPLRVAAAVAGPPVLAELVIAAASLTGTAATAIRIAGWVLAVAVVISTVVRPLMGQVAAARVAAADAHGKALVARTEVDFRSSFERALAQTESEPAAIRCLLRAVSELRPETDTALLLSVPDEPKVGWSVRLVDGELEPARPVPDTPGCAALASATTTSTTSSSLDACAHVTALDMAVASICIPMRLDDRLLGAVSMMDAPGESPDDHTIALLEWIVERTAVRVSEQRRLQGRSVIAREDDITGLPGPQALDRQLRDSIRSLVPFCVALVDVDDFAGLRRHHGEDDTNDSLRVLADSLRLTLRPEDLVCRLDGGRFAVVLGNCGATHASLALERVREALALTLSMDHRAPFTFSAGVVESHKATSIDDLMDRATRAAKLAHGNGGNRVAVAPD